MSISPAIAALVARMDQHPEEFINSSWSPIGSMIDPYENTRWGDITAGLHPTKGDSEFTPEEIAAYNDKLKVLYRARVDGAIIKELVSSEHADELAIQQSYRERQLNLPLGTTNVNAWSAKLSGAHPKSVINVTGQDKIMADALKIIRGQTP